MPIRTFGVVIAIVVLSHVVRLVAAPAPAAPAAVPATQPATQPHERQPAAPPIPEAAPNPATSRPALHAAGPEGERTSVTEGQVMIGGQALRYKATTGRMALKDDAGKTHAEVFYVAYEKQPVSEDRSQRPITFVFNGGPGAAAVWLHMGTAGPKRIAFDEHGNAPMPPYRIEDNPNTWLTATDLVFIDPVGTGYSRAAAGEKPEQFFGVMEDVRSVAEVIRLYTTQNQRWLSPKFLAGESYGTTRAAGLSDYLLQQDGIALNGIVLISSVLDFKTIEAGPDNDLPYALYLPSYTSIAHYYKKLPPDLQQAELEKTRAQVAQWATHDYMVALAAGSAMTPQQRDDVADHLSRYTGLPKEIVLKADLRIDPTVFRAELLSDRREVIGRFDARIAGFNPYPLTPEREYDPSLGGYLAAYTATFEAYVRQTLKYEDDHAYEVLSNKVHPWNFGPAGNGYLNVSGELRDAMMKSPRMRVLFCNGLSDLATPYLAADYTIQHMTLNDALRANISHNLYEGGHMLYHYHPSLEKLGKDIGSFIQESIKAGQAPETQP